MKVNIKTIKNNEIKLGKMAIKFNFIFDNNDVYETISTNRGNGKIKLNSNNCTFYFPFEFNLPHPDLCAFAALKVISPYIGDTFEMDRGVSYEYSKFIKARYPKIKNVKIDYSLKPFCDSERFNTALSFSGGVDSVAVSMLLKEDINLIMLAKTKHHEINDFVEENDSDAQINTLLNMPANFNKILVYSDFPYLSIQNNVCKYPDSYAFTIPSILLAEHLGIKNLITGDIIDSPCNDCTIYNDNFVFKRSKNFFKGLGIEHDYPCNGVSELTTLKIAKDNGLLEITSACEKGKYKKPCMKCIKCFRKSIFRWALFDEKLTDEQLENFNNSEEIVKFANDYEKTGLRFMPSLKYSFLRIDYEFKDNLLKIRNKAMSFKEDVNWVVKIAPESIENRSEIINSALKELKNYTSVMTKEEHESFKKLNWKFNFESYENE